MTARIARRRLNGPRPTGILGELRLIRLAQDRGQLELAATIGCAHTSLSGWESGRVPPNFLSVVAWANALGYDLVLVRRP